MKKLLSILFLLMLASCNPSPEEIKSSQNTPKARKILIEKGAVVAKQYQGEINASGTSVGLSSNGTMSTGVVSIHEDAKFDVVFRCEHKVIFTIDRSDIYAKLNEKDSVTIEYINGEHWYEDKYIFIDANKMSQW